MKPPTALICAFVLICAGNMVAQPAGTTSASGQFIIFGGNNIIPPGSLVAGPKSGSVTLQPALLAVSCEHIKVALWRSLGGDTSWSGTVYLNLHRARFTDEQVTLSARKFGDRWIYRLDLPDRLDENRFVRAIVQVLLLDRANRNAGARSAEIPDWLAEGFAQQLLTSEGGEILPSPPEQVENLKKLNWVELNLSDAPKNIAGLNSRKLNPLAEVQATLQGRPPLTFEQLSWPRNGQLAGEPGKIYRSCAHLFVNQLLTMKNGPACFRVMLNELARRYNWQFAFLSGFRDYFQTPLDVEKWWALQLVQFTGRDLTQTWTTEESWKKLDEILFAPAELRTKSDELPRHTAVTLQTILRQLSAERQVAALQSRLVKLDALRMRVSQDVVPLVDDYRGVLRAYLVKHGAERPGFLFFRRSGSASEQLVAETIKQLDALDSKREALRGLVTLPMTAATTPQMSR